MIRIITDSNCDLELSECKDMNIDLIHMKLQFGNEQFIDKITITNDIFYEKLASSKHIPTTTLITPYEYTEMFQKYPNDELIVITISGKLSGTYQSAVIAKENLSRNDIYIVDSKSATVGMGLLVKQAVRLVNSDMDIKDIHSTLISYADRIKVIAGIDTLKYLVKGGRLSNFSGHLGTLLNIKPIIVTLDGEIKLTAKARGTKDLFQKLTDILNKECPIDKAMPVAYAHSNNPQAANDFKSYTGFEGDIYTIGSIVGTHAGPDAVAIAYFQK